MKESYRTDSVALAQRLIRGEYIGDERDKANWIWLSSQKIGFIAQNIVRNIPKGETSCMSTGTVNKIIVITLYTKKIHLK